MFQLDSSTASLHFLIPSLTLMLFKGKRRAVDCKRREHGFVHKKQKNSFCNLHPPTRAFKNVRHKSELIPTLFTLPLNCIPNPGNPGPSGKAVRQYFPYVSSESDLQRYKAITFHKHPSNDTRASSSLSNVPSDSTRTKVCDDLPSKPHFSSSSTSLRFIMSLPFYIKSIQPKKKQKRIEN